MYGNGRPTISNKKMVRVCLGLTVMAWATQVLFKQWGYGAEMPAARPAVPAAVGGAVASNAAAVGGAVASNAAAVAELPDAGPADAAPGGRAADRDRTADRQPTAAERFVADPAILPAAATPPAARPAAGVVGRDAPVAPAPAPAPAAAAERFIAARPAAAAVGAALELRSEATVTGAEVRLKQVGRWARRDAEFFRPAGELVLARLDARTPYKVVTVAEVRRTLADAGVNVALVRFAGPTGCAVNRADAKPDADTALANWIDAKEKGTLVAEANQASGGQDRLPAPLPVAVAEPAGARTAGRPAPVSAPTPTVAALDRPAVRSLRDVLTDDLSARLRVPVEQLQVTFNAKDDRLLNLCEPQFKFDVDPQRVRNLGDVIWGVTVLAGGSAQKATVAATARAWQTQAVVNRLIAYRGLIRPEDVLERRGLVDRLPDEPLLTVAQAVDQQAGRDLKPGTVLTGRMVEAVPLCKAGDLVTVTLTQGGVRVRGVARAREGGSFGQRIQVRNEATNETLSVVMTGPQEGTVGEPAVP
jgi:flagella basal body P-ring formation protein FlgA